MNIILLLLGFSVVLVGLGEGICRKIELVFVVLLDTCGKREREQQDSAGLVGGTAESARHKPTARTWGLRAEQPKKYKIRHAFLFVWCSIFCERGDNVP